jgi:hypothetical protein
MWPGGSVTFDLRATPLSNGSGLQVSLLTGNDLIMRDMDVQTSTVVQTWDKGIASVPLTLYGTV